MIEALGAIGEAAHTRVENGDVDETGTGTRMQIQYRSESPEVIKESHHKEMEMPHNNSHNNHITAPREAGSIQKREEEATLETDQTEQDPSTADAKKTMPLAVTQIAD